MAVTERETIIPNRGKKKKNNRSGGRAFARSKKKSGVKRHAPRTKPRKANASRLVGLTLNKGRKPAKKGAIYMAKAKKAGATAGHHGKTKKRSNRGRMGAGHHHSQKRKRNAGTRSGGGMHLRGLGDYMVNGLFVVAGALGTKLITQMVLGASNTGVMGYGVNALTGGLLWFGTEKVLKNPAASAGVISGTVVQIIIRLINDYTPFGQYVAQMGMGDYQAQAFLTPQVLVDPYNSATIRFPPALLAAAAAAMPQQSTAAKMSAAAGVGGFDPLYSGNGSLY